MDLDLDDPNERPTLPAPISANEMRAFDTPAEVFFSSTATLPGATHTEPMLALTEAEELAQWWVEQRRRTLVGWVAAAVALCAGVLVAGLLAAPV